MSRGLVTRVALAAALAVALLLPAAAWADQGAAVIRDCLNNGRITGHYSQKAYSQALAELPTDVAEYSDCPNLIRQAQLAAAGGGSGGQGGGPGGFGGGPGGGSAGGPPFTAAERHALGLATLEGGKALNLDGQMIRPGVVHANLASAVNTLPTPLLALLLALAACGLGGLGTLLRNRVRARRSN